MTNKYPKILHISTPDSWRGGEQQMVYLIEELDKIGVKQHLLCTKNSAVHDRFKSKKIPFSTSSKLFSTDPIFAKNVTSVCKKEAIDIIHVHDSHAHTFAVMSTALFGNKTPIIVSRRVDFPIRSSFLSKWKYNHENIKKILCVSDKIKEITSKGIENKEVLKTVYSGIDLSKFENTAASNKLRSEFNISDDEVLIGNVAAIAPHKDYYTFIATVEELIKRGVKAKYIAIGDGPMYKEIKQLINEKGLSKEIVMTGFRSDIPEILPELDIFLITSETEGLGTSILDAFACKVPVVATPAGGIPEIVIHEKTGLLGNIKNPLTLANQVERYLSDIALQQSMTKGATEHLQHFTKTATAEQTLKAYLEVLR